MRSTELNQLPFLMTFLVKMYCHRENMLGENTSLLFYYEQPIGGKNKAKVNFAITPSLSSCSSLCVSIGISPSCASVGIWELLLLELLLLLLLLCELMEGLDRNFLVCLGPAEEDEEVDEPPLGREPSLGFLTPLDWSTCV